MSNTARKITTEQDSALTRASEELQAAAKAFAPHLSSYLAEQFGLKNTGIVLGNGNSISAKTRFYSLYLRVVGRNGDGWPKGALVFAQLNFLATQKGHGTRLFQLHCRQCNWVRHQQDYY